MRQAGRYLPEYRALKQGRDFLALAHTPELAAEATLQPLRRFSLDAAIIFSDILAVPEALGQGYHFRENGGGIAMDFLLENAAQISALTSTAGGVRERLDYLAQALRLVRSELGGGTALLGFAGAPWTLAAYMVDGGGTGGAQRLHTLEKTAPALFETLMETVADAVAESLRLQLGNGADAVQIFDSWGALCGAPADYERLSLRWTRRVIAALPVTARVIVFAKGAEHSAAAIAAAGARVVSAGHGVRLRDVANAAGAGTAVQGNIDPAVLLGSPEDAAGAVNALLADMGGHAGHILNLGHGITPDARIECVSALVETCAAKG